MMMIQFQMIMDEESIHIRLDDKEFDLNKSKLIKYFVHIHVSYEPEIQLSDKINNIQSKHVDSYTVINNSSNNMKCWKYVSLHPNN